jgi:hypothetical protein
VNRNIIGSNEEKCLGTRINTIEIRTIKMDKETRNARIWRLGE